MRYRGALAISWYIARSSTTPGRDDDPRFEKPLSLSFALPYCSPSLSLFVLYLTLSSTLSRQMATITNMCQYITKLGTPTYPPTQPPFENKLQRLVCTHSHDVYPLDILSASGKCRAILVDSNSATKRNVHGKDGSVVFADIFDASSTYRHYRFCCKGYMSKSKVSFLTTQPPINFAIF